jgi:Domain of unknown function (DUF4279)
MTEFSVAFRVKSTDLDPQDVTNALGLEPSKSHKRGDAHRGPSGKRYSDFSGGLWSLKSPLAASASLDEHLLALLDQLGSRAATIRELTVDYRIDFFIGVFGNGLGNFVFSISGEVLQSVAKLRVTLDFDVYEVNNDTLGNGN